MLITRSGPDVSEHSKRLIEQALKSAALATIDRWHEQYLPLHFTVEGFNRYGYQPRKGQDEPSLIYSESGRAVRQGKYGRLVNNPKYYWRKWREKRTHDPLVFSGESKRQAEQSIRLSAQAQAGGSLIHATGILDLPRYFYQYNKEQNAPDKADELLRTTSAEEADLAAFFNAAAGLSLASASAPATRRQIA